MDVEDVRGTLAPYHALLRDQLEHYGGTVEKFIGDAVMALFGAPVTHEDDPERAVRAALSIRAAIDRLNEQEPGLDLHVRVGVNTGEALVVLGADAGRGEGVASGDVVNTAARLQSAAPVDGILVGETTYHATDRAITYRQVEPVVAKGKARPVPAWEAVEARARFGVDVVQRPTTPLVGRGAEVDLLLDALRRCRAERAVQLVTLVGVPGIGKSRLVWELFEAVEREPDFVTWRQGRSLPYGDGVTYWALGEMITAQAGILDSDTADEARRQAQGDRRGPDRAIRGGGGLGRGARAGAGRASRPTGASSGDRQQRGGRRLAAVPRGAGRAQPARARVRGPALGGRRAARLRRPPRRSGERRADARGLHRSAGAARSPRRMGRRQAKRAHDRPLAARRRRYRAHDRRRCSSRRCSRPRRRRRCSATAEGNPLYAEEYVRMLIDRGHLRHEGGRWRLAAEATLPVPESVHGLIAARLDDLPADQKQLLQDAAVLGQGRLARRARRDERREPVRGGGAPARARAPRDAAARAAVVGRRRGRVRVPARPRARRRLRPDPARPAGREAPAGGGMDRVALGRPRERPGHGRPPLLAGARVRPRCGSGDRRARAADAARPPRRGRARGGAELVRRRARSTTTRRSSCGPRTTRTGRCWSWTPRTSA